MIIGLTGKYCAGKNHIAIILEKRGLPVLDVDKLGYQVLEQEKQSIFSRFGDDLQKPDGSLNRQLLGKRVFGKPASLTELEAIVHPGINRLTDEWVKNQTGACVVNAALLHKSSVFIRLNRIILVTAPFFIRFFRARQRDKLSYLAILKRFSSQKDFFSYNLSVNTMQNNAEIYRVGNPGLCKKCNIRNKKLEKQIDLILEGII
jgi:dephospho-CoA kinase